MANVEGKAAKGGSSGRFALPVESDMATMRVEHEEACRRLYLNFHTSEAKPIHRSGHASATHSNGTLFRIVTLGSLPLR